MTATRLSTPELRRLIRDAKRTERIWVKALAAHKAATERLGEASRSHNAARVAIKHYIEAISGLRLP